MLSGRVFRCGGRRFNRIRLTRFCSFTAMVVHFYSSLYLGLGQRMAERGIAFLTANRRGHDHLANGARGGPLAGYAFESVDDSRADFAAWLELLREKGPQSHSYWWPQRRGL